MRTRNLLLIIAVVGLFALFWIVWDQQATMAVLRNSGPWPFFGAMALLPAIGAPLTPFFLLAGASFGVQVGLIGSALALAVNLTLCYWVARSGLHGRLEAILARFDYEMPNFETRRPDAVRLAVVVKLAPGVPNTIKHYGLALAGVPFAAYFGISMLVTGVYAAALVVLGESLLDHDLDRVFVTAAIVVAAGGGLWLFQSRRRRGSRPLPVEGGMAGQPMSVPPGTA